MDKVALYKGMILEKVAEKQSNPLSNITNEITDIKDAVIPDDHPRTLKAAVRSLLIKDGMEIAKKNNIFNQKKQNK